MPRRVATTADQITEALIRTGGRRAAAAELLGISSKTLKRRLAADPSLMPDVRSLIWDRAVEGWDRIAAAPDPHGRHADPYARFADRLDWDEVTIPPDPVELSNDELEQFADRILQGPVDVVRICGKIIEFYPIQLRDL